MLHLPDFSRSFLRLAIVNVLSNLMVPLAGLIDVAFLGHLSEIRHLAGVALTTVLFNYIYWTFGFLRMGTTGMTAQAVGRNDQEAVILTGCRNALLGLGFGLAIWVLQSPLRELGFALLQATPEVKASGLDYYNAMIWGAPATLINFVLNGWFLGRRQGSNVLLLSAIANSTDVGLNYLFIVRWGWGSAGAGWSTVLSQYFMLCVGLGLVIREIPLQQFAVLFPKLFDPVALKATFSLSSDITIRTFVLVSTFALFTNLSSALGTTVLAANSLMLQIVTLSAHFIDGVAFATESYAGIFWGQGAKQELRSLIWLSGWISLVLGLIFALTFILFPQPLFSLLTSHNDIVEQVVQYVVWLLPVLGIGSLAFMLDGYFLGLTAGRILRNSSLMAAVVGCGAMAIAFWQSQNPHGLWFALSLFMCARVVTLGLHLPKTLS